MLSNVNLAELSSVQTQIPGIGCIPRFESEYKNNNEIKISKRCIDDLLAFDHLK
jgi:hypothetical protein